MGAFGCCKSFVVFCICLNVCLMQKHQEAYLKALEVVRLQ